MAHPKKTGVGVAAAVALLVVALGWWYSRPPQPCSRSDAPATVAQDEPNSSESSPTNSPDDSPMVEPVPKPGRQSTAIERGEAGALEFAGRVVREDGAAIVGATVTLRDAQSSPWSTRVPSSAVASATTDDIGEFRIDVAQRQSLTLDVNAIGFARHFVRGYHTGAFVVVTLRPGRVVRVQVVDEEDQPVTGAEVAFQKIGLRSPGAYAYSNFPSQNTDERGFAQVSVVGSGTLSVRVGKRGYASDRTSLDLPTNESTFDHRVVLQRAKQVRGRLVSEIHAGGMQGQVWLGRRRDHAVATEPDGSFEIDWDGFAESISACAPGHVVARARVRLDTRIEMDLDPGITMTGHVVDAAGRSLAGAAVEALAESAFVGPLVTTSDAQGRFRFEHVSSERHYTIRVSARGHGRHFMPVPASDRLASIDVGTIQLMVGRTLRGRVVSASKQPVPHLAMILAPVEDAGGNTVQSARPLARRTHTDADGRYRFGQLEPGRYRIGYRRGFPARDFAVVVESRDVERNVTVPCNHLLRFRFHGPVDTAGVHIMVYGARGEKQSVSGSTWRDSLVPLKFESRSYVITRFGRRSVEQTHSIPRGTAAVDVRFHSDPTHVLTCMLRDESDAAIPNAEIRVEASGSPDALRTAVTDAEGKCRLDGFSSSVSLHYEGWRRVGGRRVWTPMIATQLKITPARGEVHLRAKALSMTRKLRVVVVNAEGKPVPGASIVVKPYSTRGPIAKTDRQGVAELRGLPALPLQVLGVADRQGGLAQVDRDAQRVRIVLLKR